MFCFAAAKQQQNITAIFLLTSELKRGCSVGGGRGVYGLLLLLAPSCLLCFPIILAYSSWMPFPLLLFLYVPPLSLSHSLSLSFSLSLSLLLYLYLHCVFVLCICSTIWWGCSACNCNDWIFMNTFIKALCNRWHTHREITDSAYACVGMCGLLPCFVFIKAVNWWSENGLNSRTTERTKNKQKNCKLKCNREIVEWVYKTRDNDWC